MSEIEKTIDHDLKEAMKSKEALKVETLRMVKTAFMESKTQKNADKFDDQKGIEIISKMIKTRTETSNTYVKAGRIDLSDKEMNEVNLLMVYLPNQIDNIQLEDVVTCAINIAIPPVKMGDVIKEAKRIVAQENLIVDGKRLSEMVKRLMGN